MTPFFALFIAAGAFAVGFGVRARMFFPVVWGGLFGGIPLVMATSIPFFNASLWILGVLAAGMFAWGYAKGRSSDWMKRLGGGFLPRSESDPSITDDRTSSSTSSGSSDSFSGGESGGGGASGSW